MTIFGCGRGGITRVKTVAGGGGGVTTPSILGSVSTKTNSTNPHSTDTIAHTVTAGTELLLLIVFFGSTDNTEAMGTVSSDVDGALDVLSAPPDLGGSTISKPAVGLWTLANPTAGAHNISYPRNGIEANTYSGAVAINLDDIDTADPIGDIENTRVGTAQSSFLSSLTTEKSNSLIIAWGAWQDGSNPITEDEGLTQLVEPATGTAGTADGVMSVATKTGPEIPGITAYGFTATEADDNNCGAVEIRGAG